MPILSRVGRQSWGARAVLATFYLILTAGAVTMIYPLLLMLATSVTGPADSSEFALVPRYLYRDDALLARVLSEKYLGTAVLADHYGPAAQRLGGFELPGMLAMFEQLNGEIGWDPHDPLHAPRLRQLREYEQFVKDVAPNELIQVGFEQEVGVPRLGDRLWWRFLARRFEHDLAAINRAYGEGRDSLLLVRMPHERIMYRSWTPPTSRKYDDFLVFKSEIRRSRLDMLQSLNGDVYWRTHVQDCYNGRIEKLNEAWGTRHASFDELHLPLTQPMESSERRASWDDYVRRKWSPRHLKWDDAAIAPVWRAYLQERYGTVAEVNAAHARSYSGFDDIPLPTAADLVGQTSADFYAFVRGEGGAPPDLSKVRLLTLAGTYRQFLREKYETVQDVNRAYGRAYASWDDVAAPAAAYDWWKVVTHSGAWRWYFVSNNFHLVWDRIAVRGGALANTVAFVVLNVLLALTVNPMCAYALSRFGNDLGYGGKVLLVLLATMAFPAEVTMIPGFLLLRDLGLLNTFAALLLPGAASGFAIFILKGFFDTLPRELYEAAQLDGAGELRMFWQIAVPLSQPVLAYVALVSFTAAYTTFLFAMVLCQDERLWTLMVWIYQLQGTVHESAQIAALLVVMLPTFLVFVLCQRVIMRGIVLPQMN